LLSAENQISFIKIEIPENMTGIKIFWQIFDSLPQELYIRAFYKDKKFYAWN